MGRCIWITVFMLVLFQGILTADSKYKGDCSRDGKLSILDVVQHLLIARANPADERLDFNCDGDKNAEDVICLVRYLYTSPPLEYNLPEVKTIFLHHSTGNNIWNGGVSGWFDGFNADSTTQYLISKRAYPSGSPYSWNNYPYDYWNIWVDHAGNEPYLQEPTLELLSADYDIIVFKHCYPVSDIRADTGSPAVNSEVKRIENYKLQYDALKEKMRQFPLTRFVVWTGAALVQGNTNQATAQRAKDFFSWVVDEWDQPVDNIFVWDFYQLETDGTLYLKDEYATSASNSHPNSSFSGTAAPLFCRRLVDVIKGVGDQSPVTGKY